MAWRPIERHVEKFRDCLETDPVGVRQQVGATLEDEHDLRASDRLRLLGLVVAANRKLGAFDQAEAAVISGTRIRTPSPVARADFLLQAGALRMDQGRADEALAHIERAGRLMTRELEKPKPLAKESLRRRRWIEATKAASHILRGEVFLHLSIGTIEEAFTDALTALRLTSNLVKAASHTRRVHLAAVTLLCGLVVRFKSPTVIREALGLVEHAEQTLIYRCRAPAGHPHRIKLKWCRAVALARLGRCEKAEGMLTDVVDRLIAGGFCEDARKALDALVWVVKQTRIPARAAYMLKKYGSFVCDASVQ